MVTLRTPALPELPTLSALCLRSKAYWGYDAAFMAACADELTLTEEDLSDALVVAAQGETPIGVAQVSYDGDCYLEKLFVDPNHMGHGAGRILFKWAVQAAGGLGASTMIVEADPDAVPFYEKMGCVAVGDVASGSIPGRRIPRLLHHLG